MSLLLLDTHLLLWSAGMSGRLPAAARAMIDNDSNTLAFSAASLWEIVIKVGRGREDFQVDPRRLRGGLMAAGYREIPIAAEHAIAVGRLPPLHKDPFDRMLIAQAEIEGAELLTADPIVARYPGSIRLVG
jgi:PIN domain nuclease of toxin-antitoxin system